MAHLWANASPNQLQAMEVLESRGLVFCVHFGTDNAEARLKALDVAMEDDRLYEHLRHDLGIVTK